MSWFRVEASHIVLMLYVQPGARRTEVVGMHGDALKIRLAAPPVDGKANQCLCAFLAERFGVPAGRVELVQGQTSRTKRVLIHAAGRHPDEALALG